MKRKATAWLVVLACLAALPTSARAADLFLLGYNGFDYEDPNPVGGPLSTGYLALGEGYRMVGFITSANPAYLPLDFVNDENTVNVGDAGNSGDLVVTFRDFIDPFIVVNCSAGHVRFYQDPKVGGASNALYGVNPPNATAPSTFIDGVELLAGDLDNFSLTYDTDASDGTTDGSWTANLNFFEGAMLVFIPFDQRQGWNLTGQLGFPNPTIPQGYANQTSGECRIPDTTPTTVKSWGSIKKLYR